MKVTACVLIALIGLVAFASADHTLGTGFSQNTLIASLTHDQEVTVCGSATDRGTGYCTLTRDGSDQSQLACVVSHNIVGATDAHVHNGAAGTNGGVVFPFTVALPGHFEETFTIADNLIDDFLNGNFYFNIHTAGCTGGIIRGQMTNDFNVFSNMNGANEVPAAATTAAGVGIGLFTAGDNVITNTIVHDVTATGAHIHTGAAGVNGNILFGFADPTSPIEETFTFASNGDVRNLFGQTEGLYYNVHSNTFTGGEIRGQLSVADAIPRINYAFPLSGTQEVPAVNDGTSGVAIVWVDAVTGFMEYTIYHDIPNPTAAHVHLGAAGMNGAVEFALPGFTSPMQGSATLTQTQMDNLADGLFYINIHSTENPNGEIRGQIVQTNNNYSYLSGTQENPPVTTSAGGVAIVNLTGNQLVFQIYHNVVGADAAHIHEATVGLNGGVVFTLNVADNIIVGSITLNTAQIDSLNGASFYFNIHNAANPTGAIRGQILNIAPALVAGGGGDPHFLGFDGSDYDFHGLVGDVFNLITDSDIQVNFQLVDFDRTSQIYDSFIGALGFVTAKGDSVIFDAGNVDVESTVTINGDVFTAAELGDVEGRSFSIKRVENHSVPSHLGFPEWHTVGEVFTITFDRYTFELFMVDFNGVASGVMRFIDFTTATTGVGHNPHGTLGRTLVGAGHARSVGAFGTAEDFKVADGILGSDFAFNRFALE